MICSGLLCKRNSSCQVVLKVALILLLRLWETSTVLSVSIARKHLFLHYHGLVS